MLRFPQRLLPLLPADLALSAAMFYALGYCTCLRPVELYTVEHARTARLHVAAYCWENSGLERFFAPANCIDRALRPAYWHSAAAAPAGLEDGLTALAQAAPPELSP